MGNQKVIHSLDNIPSQPTQFRTERWFEILK